jgi:hypothetical protein
MTPVMRMLAAHVPVTLLLDLADAGLDSAEIATAEGGAAEWLAPERRSG